MKLINHQSVVSLKDINDLKMDHLMLFRSKKTLKAYKKFSNTVQKNRLSVDL